MLSKIKISRNILRSVIQQLWRSVPVRKMLFILQIWNKFVVLHDWGYSIIMSVRTKRQIRVPALDIWRPYAIMLRAPCLLPKL